MASKDSKIPEKQDDSSFNEIKKRFKANPFIFIGTVLVLIIVIVAFVFLPMNPVGPSQGSELNFGSYNKKPITYVNGNYFYRVQQSLASQYQSSMDNYNYQETLYRIWRGAFEETVLYMGILDEMSRAGYQTPDDVVDMEMALLSDFQENGQFSFTRYRQMDNTTRMTLWRQIRDSIAVNYYISDMTNLLISSNEMAFISSMGIPQRSFDMVSFSIYSYPDTEIEAYARANPDMFRNTHLSRITLSNEREARQILSSLQNGTETFENAARNLSTDYYADNSGDMGNRMVFELTAEIPDNQTEGLLSLSRGELSNIIRVADNSWAIFRAEENVRQADIQDPATMDKIRNYIMTYRRGDVEDWLVSQAEVFTNHARLVDFDSAVADFGFYKNSFGPLPLNYGDTSLFSSVTGSGIGELNYAGTNERFWQAAFATPLNTASVPVVVGNNVIVLCPTEEIDEDEYGAELIGMYYAYWLSNAMDYDLRNYFMSNGKLDDRFWDVFQYFLE